MRSARVFAAATLAACISGCAGFSETDRRPPPVRLDPVLEETAPLRFSRADTDLRRGDVVGQYQYAFGRCHPFEEDLYWGEGAVRDVARGWRGTVHRVLSDVGYRVTDDPNKLFDDIERNRRSAGYLLGATIVDLRMEVCEHTSLVTGEPAERQSGAAEIEVEWSLYGTLDERVVFRATTSGTGATRRGHRDGVPRIVETALVDSLERLAANEEFRRVLTRAPSVRARRRLAGEPVAPAPPRVLNERAPRQTAPLETGIAQLRRSVVTVRGGRGHGSGFFITPSMLLTNAHVVRGDPVVPIEFVDGRQVFARVSRRHVPRDIALLEVEPGGYPPLPIRRERVGVAETVFAVGTPLERKLAGTVSRGTVSAHRVDKESGLPMIQADVDVHGGNSGGPLLDAGGNVVGVTVAGYAGADAAFSVGLNRFIPILDGLAKLGLRLEEARPAAPRPAAGLPDVRETTAPTAGDGGVSDGLGRPLSSGLEPDA